MGTLHTNPQTIALHVSTAGTCGLDIAHPYNKPLLLSGGNKFFLIFASQSRLEYAFDSGPQSNDYLMLFSNQQAHPAQ